MAEGATFSVTMILCIGSLFFHSHKSATFAHLQHPQYYVESDNEQTLQQPSLAEVAHAT